MEIKEKIIFRIFITLLLVFSYSFSFAILRDPTLPIGKNLSGVAGIKIDAIIIGKTRKIVTIDGRQLVEGDKIRGTTIVEIQPDKVVFEDESGKFDIYMAGSGIKLNPTTVIPKDKTGLYEKKN